MPHSTGNVDRNLPPIVIPRSLLLLQNLILAPTLKPPGYAEMSNIPSSVFVYIWDTCETGDCYRCRPSVSGNVCYRSPFDRLIDDLTYETLGRIYAVAAHHGNVRSRENTARTGGRHTLGEYSFVARKICQIGMKYMKLFYTSIGGVILHAYHIVVNIDTKHIRSIFVLTQI